MKLIDKDALTEKLWERRIKHRDFGGSPHSEYGHEDDEILSLIDTLEVKEVELSWEDIKVIEKLLGFDNIIESPREFYQEVLKRFKAQKGE